MYIIDVIVHSILNNQNLRVVFANKHNTLFQKYNNRNLRVVCAQNSKPLERHSEMMR